MKVMIVAFVAVLNRASLAYSPLTLQLRACSACPSIAHLRCYQQTSAAIPGARSHDTTTEGLLTSQRRDVPHAYSPLTDA